VGVGEDEDTYGTDLRIMPVPRLERSVTGRPVRPRALAGFSFYDSSRAYGKRIEAGVGGRFIEVYDATSGDGLELARITLQSLDLRPGRPLTR
jgi:hypothetical protein